MLPGYDKTKRRRAYQQLPKGAYVCTIKNAKEVANKSGAGSHLEIAFDIAEGDYKDFYLDQYRRSTEKKWPSDAFYYLNVPDNASESYAWDYWNSFFADLEDSNDGYQFAGDLGALKGKLIGGKFRIEQSEHNGKVYDHTRMLWSCIAEDVRQGRAGQLPDDKLIASDYVDIPAGAANEAPW